MIATFAVFKARSPQSNNLIIFQDQIGVAPFSIQEDVNHRYTQMDTDENDS
jgi:hypothetical protein